MYLHHTETIQNAKQYFEGQQHVLALLSSGSIAHGFESEDSDVDILIIVTEEEYQRWQQSSETTFFNTSLCNDMLSPQSSECIAHQKVTKRPEI
jgi:predicted nucleotidyltransferase